MLWPIEGRCAAVANNYFTFSINRVGKEFYPNPLSTGDAAPSIKELCEFFGMSYITAPDGTRTPELNRTTDGIVCLLEN